MLSRHNPLSEQNTLASHYTTSAGIRTPHHSSRLQAKHLLKILPYRRELCLCCALILLDQRAVELELWLGAEGTDGNPGAIGKLVLEQVRRRQVGDALGEIEYFVGLMNEIKIGIGLLPAQGIHDGGDLLLARDALELVRGLGVIVVAVFAVELLQAVAERLALCLIAGGHLRDEQGGADGVFVLRVGADEAAVALLVSEEEVVRRVLLVRRDLTTDALERTKI